MANDLIFNATATYADSKFGQGLSGGRADFPSAVPSTNPSLPFTMEGWFRTTNTSAITVITGHFGSSVLVWYLGINASGQLSAYYNNSSGSNNAINSTANVADGANHHWAVVFSTTGSLTVYLDGQSIGTINSTSYTGSSKGGKLTLGYFNSAYDFVGAIDEVAIWNTARYTAAFTPPTAPYTGSESGMTALYHLDGSGANSQSGTATPVGSTIGANDTSLASSYSPYTWKWDGTSINANSPGSYIRFSFGGTSLAVNTVALSGLSSYPTLAWSIDNGPVQKTSIASGQASFTLASGLTSATHSVEILLLGSDQLNRWSLACALKIKSFTIDANSTITAPTLRSKNAIWYGDSISEGFHINSDLSNDCIQAEVPAIAKMLDAEYGQVAYTGQGFTQAGGGDIPALSTAYSFYSSGVSRLVNGVLSPAPDYLISMHGTNGSPSQSDIAAQISNWRTIAPSAKIIMVVPPNGSARSQITGATNAAITAGDTNLFLVDAGTAYQNGLAQYNTPSRQAYDGLHPTGQTNIGLAAAHGALIRQALNGTGGTTTVTVTKRFFRSLFG